MILDIAPDRGNGALEQIEPAVNIADGVQAAMGGLLRILHGSIVRLLGGPCVTAASLCYPAFEEI